MNPVTHLHLKPSPSLSQLPPCWQGLLRHGSTTAHEKIHVELIKWQLEPASSKGRQNHVKNPRVLQARLLMTLHHSLTAILPQHAMNRSSALDPLYVMLVHNSLHPRNLWGCCNDFYVGIWIIHLYVILVGASQSHFTIIQQNDSGLEQSNLLTQSTVRHSDQTSLCTIDS